MESEMRRTSVGAVGGVERPRSNSQSGGAGGRRMSRITEIRPRDKPSKPLMDWLYEHFDKAAIGLAINFVILIILLMMLKNFMSMFAFGGADDDKNAAGDD